MGTYRLILATCVLLAHAGVVLFGHNQGVTAVISFFLLSGFLMTALIRRNYDSKEKIKKFYLDRALRLFPQFFFYFIITLIFVSITSHQSPFLEDLSWFKIVMNALMLPLSLYMLGLEKSLLIPQAWSLGLELTFYISIPFILLHRLERPAFVLSFCVFGFAYFGIIDSDAFGYRLLPGTLFMFLLGSFLYERKSTERLLFLVITYVVSLIAFLLVLGNNSFMRPYNYEVLLGILIGLPIVAGLTKLHSNKIDEFFGNISYGVFLNHFLLIWVFQALKINTNSASTISILAAISVMLAWLTYNFVEKPVLTFRRNLRQNKINITYRNIFQRSN